MMWKACNNRRRVLQEFRRNMQYFVGYPYVKCHVIDIESWVEDINKAVIATSVMIVSGITAPLGGHSLSLSSPQSLFSFLSFLFSLIDLFSLSLSPPLCLSPLHLLSLTHTHAHTRTRTHLDLDSCCHNWQGRVHKVDIGERVSNIWGETSPPADKMHGCRLDIHAWR